jgi:hypothetical protein
MDYNYEFLKIEPKQLFVQVKYSSDGNPDVFKNLIVGDFTEANIMLAVQRAAIDVVSTWEKIAAAPDSLTLSNGTLTVSTPLPRVENPRPSYDPFTEKLEPNVVQTDTQIVTDWVIVPLTATEQEDYLTGWRQGVFCTMRQARLALSQQGLLATVQSNIEALPEESQIEWEYAGSVERSSPLVQSLGAALGLSDEDLDNLFKLAITL